MDKRIVIGKIGAPHGIRGEVRITPLTDFPGRFENLRMVFVEEQEIVIERMQYHHRFIILKFAGVNDRSAAELFKGKLLHVDRKDVPPLEPGEYYAFDVIGLKVTDEVQGELGEIVEILKTGSNDVYIAKQNGQETLIPALKSVVLQIDLENGRMQVCLPEEMNANEN